MDPEDFDDNDFYAELENELNEEFEDDDWEYDPFEEY